MGKNSIVDAAWDKARVTASVRDALSGVDKTVKVEILLQLVAEEMPNEAPRGMRPISSESKEWKAETTPRLRYTRNYDTPETREKIAKLLPRHDVGITVPDLAHKTSVLPSHLRIILGKMHEAGEAVRINRNRWRATDKSKIESENPLRQNRRKMKRKPKRSDPTTHAKVKAACVRRDKIWKCIENTWLRARQIADLLGDKYNTIQRDLILMHAAGMVTKMRNADSTVTWSSSPSAPLDHKMLMKLSTKLQKAGHR